MSDLCYNCGDCHLPRPCGVALKECEICHNFGHTYNFCPLSVRHKDPGYRFWALCHNCDKWHLPEPCQYTLYKCAQCGNVGHKEFFCPINALSRNVIATPENDKTGAKRKRSNGKDAPEKTESPFVHPEVVRRIKLDATYEVLNLQSKGFNHDQIVHFMSRPANQLNGSAASSDAFDTGSGKGESTSTHDIFQRIFSNNANGSVFDTPQTDAKQQGRLQMKMPATPTPTMGSMPPSEVNDGVYSSMHDRFGRGDLSRGASQAASNLFTTNVHNQTDPEDVTSGGQFAHGSVEDESVGFRPASTMESWSNGTAVTAPVLTDAAGNNQGSTNGNVAAPELEHLLATALADSNTHDQAHVRIAPRPSVPSPTDHNGNNTQTNALQQLHMAYQQVLPTIESATEAVGYMTVPNTDENLAPPAPELKKNGEPKKKSGRKKKN